MLWIELSDRNPELRELKFFIMDHKHAGSLFCRENYLCLPTLFTIQTSLKILSRTDAVWVSVHKMYTNARNPWRIVS